MKPQLLLVQNMSNSKHTPGPWVTEEIAHTPSTLKPNCFLVRLRSDSSEDTNKESVQANAHLIAAAPEMLEALENILAAINSANEHERLASLRTDLLQNVIAKARGES